MSHAIVRRAANRLIACALIAVAAIAGICHQTYSTAPSAVPEISHLEIEMISDEEGAVVAYVDRTLEVQRIPIQVVYEITSTSRPLSEFKWIVTQADPSPFYATATTKLVPSEDGRTATIHLSSNRPQYGIRIEAVGESGQVFRGTDLLHCALVAGDTIRLGTHGDVSAVWTQAFAEKESLDYVTQNRVAVQRDQDGCFFLPDWPGNYRFVKAEGSEMTVIEAYVSMQTSRQLSMRGAFVADYYGTHWIPPNNVNIDQEIILATTALAKDLGANTFCVVNFWKVMQWYPFPLFCSTEGGPSISMTMLDAIGGACTSLGLDLYLHLGNFTPWPYLDTEEDARYWEPNSNDAKWYFDYFSEVERFALYNFQGAADAGVDFFTAQARSGNIYVGDNFERYGLNRQCEQLIEDIRIVYDGAYGWCAPYPDRDNAFLRNCDFVHLFLNWRDQFQVGSFRDSSQPLPSEVREATRDYLSRYEGKLPPVIDVFVNVSALSADSQVSIRGEAEDAPIDYQEQVAFLEGFFEAVHETPWITGVAVWNLFWMEWSPDLAEIMGDYTYNSIRGKPAEEVVRLWYDILCD